MMVTFVSQCEHKALNRTRRVLDAFANRIGSRTWQTVITEDGLQAVKKLLRKTATKNTAVSCHWIRSRSRSEFLWVVGNRRKFNQEGIVPVNYTQEDGLISKDEYLGNTVQVMALLSGIAGFFHDFGKANLLFQNKLNPKKNGKTYEAYRHEWVSLRLFEAFVKTFSKDLNSDQEWLQALVNVNNETENRVLENLIKDSRETREKPFKKLPPVAKIIAWLIVSHHRLPIYPYNKNEKIAKSPPGYTVDRNGQKKVIVDDWMATVFDSLWNSPSSFNQDWTEQERQDNWTFSHNTPFISAIWQIKVSELAKKALNYPLLFQQDWLHQHFTAHLSRLTLMLADHYYSASDASTQWQDRNYTCIANTDDNNQPKQKLDEHNIGVGTNAYDLAKELAQLRRNLPILTPNKKFTHGHYETKQDELDYGWQEKAFQLAKSLQESSKQHGFFGINMASTGKGKTVANARIMYALSDEKQGCRFNIALGLRTLTLQTGKALANMLELPENDYAVLIGSQVIKKLFDEDNKAINDEETQQLEKYKGSESIADLFPENQEIEYKGIPDSETLSAWLSNSPKLQKLIDAPLLISTIDHLMPATEGTRGGKQIAPMLRLYTSDLVLDEPDDFGIEDLPALCRLVNWSAMLGGKVLLSTATMPPALTYALFLAYQAGWKDFTQANNDKGAISQIQCAWFDEFKYKETTTSALISDFNAYKKQHENFIEKRIVHLDNETQVLRCARYLPITINNESNAITAMAQTLANAIPEIHQANHQPHPNGKNVSIGLIRMANIKPLVAVAKALLKIKPKADFRIHFCVYHSQYPLAIRHHIEQKLDGALKRNDENTLWEQEEIKTAIEQCKETQQVFIVLASPVAEVGRDHDYDWAIAEPSSMRSVIQLAGRIQRHRKKPPTSENLYILQQNFKALQQDLSPQKNTDKDKDKEPAYIHPGFETVTGKNSGNNSRLLVSHDLSEVLAEEKIQHINATTRISPLKSTKDNKDGCQRNDKGEYLDFIEMEQIALYQHLLGANKQKEKAGYWWQNQITWCAELQRRQPFRQSTPDAVYCLCFDNQENLYWAKEDNTKKIKTYPPMDNMTEVTTEELEICKGNQFWFSYQASDIFKELNYRFQYNSLIKTSRQFGELRLRVNTNKNQPDYEWFYHPNLGVFNEI